MPGGLLSKKMLNEAYLKAKKITDINALKFVECFPYKRTDANGNYARSHVYDESVGFWTGIYILIYEMNEDPHYRFITAKYVEKMYNRLFDAKSCLYETGLMYVPSCVSAYRIGKIKKAKIAAVMAADILISVYRKQDNIYFVNNKYNPPNEYEHEHMKIATMLNCSILYWASEFTGIEAYKEHADDVINFIADNLIKPDGSVYWEYNAEKGAVGECFIHGENCRGISWALYGLAVKYRQNGDRKIYDKILKVLRKYAPQIKAAEFHSLDSTMLACAVCAVYDIAPYADESFSGYVEFADGVLHDLIEKDSLEPLCKTDGILGYSDGMGGFDCPQRNVSAVAGDYFYMEALVRKLKNRQIFM